MESLVIGVQSGDSGRDEAGSGETLQERSFRDEEEGKIALYLSTLIRPTHRMVRQRRKEKLSLFVRSERKSTWPICHFEKRNTELYMKSGPSLKTAPTKLDSFIFRSHL